MKALKRTMAAEFSRELGVKVLAGQVRLAKMGYRVCGEAGLGLRRMMVSPDRCKKLLLETGGRKAIKTYRTILVPGPKKRRWPWCGRSLRLRYRRETRRERSPET
jgi:hypothetical protein